MMCYIRIFMMFRLDKSIYAGSWAFLFPAPVDGAEWLVMTFYY